MNARHIVIGKKQQRYSKTRRRWKYRFNEWHEILHEIEEIINRAMHQNILEAHLTQS